MDSDGVVETARQIAADVVRPSSAAWDREGRWPEEAARALQHHGLGGLVVSEKWGGAGGGLLDLLRVCEALGAADASVGLCFGMHAVASACIGARATDAQAARWLEPICAGEHWTTLALSEPGTGAHFYVPQLEMREDGGDYLLNGTKSFVTNGGHASSYVVSTAGADPAVGHFTMVLVDGERLDGAWGPPWSGWGMRANSSRSVDLVDVRVPRDHVLGEVGDQIWYVFHVVAPYFLVAMAGTYLGLAARAVDEAEAHLRDRVHAHTARALGELDVLQHRLGQLWATRERTRRLCYWAAAEADRGGPDSLPALCAAKAEVGTAAVDLVNEAMTLMGGRAYAEDGLMQRLLRDARAAHVMSPTTDMLYGWAGRAVLGLPILGT